MKHLTIALAALVAPAWALAATSTPPKPTEPATVTCTISDETTTFTAKTCKLYEDVDPKGPYTERLVGGKFDLRIVEGDRQGQWSSGSINGKPAMRYELNRGKFSFSTIDLKLSADYAMKGYED